MQGRGDNHLSAAKPSKSAIRISAYDTNVAPSIDCTNLYRQYLWEEQKLQSHVERIVNAKPQVDCKLPPISVSKMCEVHKMREKGARIKRLTQENQEMVRRLAQRLTNWKGAVDCWNNLRALKSTRELTQKNVQQRIERQNKQLLERLAAVPPSHQTARQHLLTDYEKHTKLRGNLRRFPQLPTRTVYNKYQGRSATSLDKDNFTQDSR